MKKTIAILLILVIGMVGVFAANEAEVNLITTVFEFSEMKITEVMPESLTWTAFPNSAVVGAFTTYTGTENANRKSIDPYTTALQSVGFLHTRTNRRGGYNIKVSATVLSSTEAVGGANVVQTIGYDVYALDAGDASATPAKIYTAGAATAEIFVSEGLSTGMRAKSTEIRVELATTGDNLSSGTYTGDITFEYVGL